MADSTPRLGISVPRSTPRIVVVPRGGVVSVPRIEIRPRSYQR